MSRQTGVSFEDWKKQVGFAPKPSLATTQQSGQGGMAPPDDISRCFRTEPKPALSTRKDIAAVLQEIEALRLNAEKSKADTNVWESSQRTQHGGMSAHSGNVRPSRSAIDPWPYDEMSTHRDNNTAHGPDGLNASQLQQTERYPSAASEGSCLSDAPGATTTGESSASPCIVDSSRIQRPEAIQSFIDKVTRAELDRMRIETEQREKQALLNASMGVVSYPETGWWANAATTGCPSLAHVPGRPMTHGQSVHHDRAVKSPRGHSPTERWKGRNTKTDTARSGHFLNPKGIGLGRSSDPSRDFSVFQGEAWDPDRNRFRKR